jgi:hypothetical protein
VLGRSGASFSLSGDFFFNRTFLNNRKRRENEGLVADAHIFVREVHLFLTEWGGIFLGQLIAVHFL